MGEEDQKQSSYISCRPRQKELNKKKKKKKKKNLFEITRLIDDNEKE